MPESHLQDYEELLHFSQKQNDEQLQLFSEIIYHNSRLRNAYDKKGIESNSYKKYAKEIKELLNRLKANNEQYLYPYALMLYSRVLDFMGNFTDAFEYKIRAYDYYSHYTIEEYPPKALHLNSLGGSYFRFRDFHSSAKIMKDVIDQQQYDNNYFTSLNTCGLSYRNLRIWDTAEVYCKQLYKEATEYKSQEWQLIAILNLGHTYYRAGDTTKAEKHFISAYEFAHRHGYKYGITESTSTLARIALSRKQYDKAKRLALEGTRIHVDNERWFFHYVIDAEWLYEVLADIYREEGNYKKAYLYLDSLLMVVDSNSANRQVNLSNAIQTKTELLTEKYLTEKDNTIAAKQKHKRTRYLAIAGILVVLVVSILLINRQIIKRRQVEAEKRAAETKLRASKNELKNYTTRLQEKNMLLEKFSQELENYKEAATQQDKNEILLRLQQSTILTDDDWITFRNLFEQVHSGFLKRLKDKVPDLTPGEIRFMVLSRMELSTKEMAGILGVGTSTIRKYRHQVRNKLGLPEDGSIEEAVDMI